MKRVRGANRGRTAPESQETISLSIDSLAFEGWGVGRYGSLVVFVPFTAPGDTVRVRITQKKKNYWYGVVEEILSPSPERASPLCPLFGVCGGCQWQHLRYDLQLRAKERILLDHLRKMAPDLQPSLPPFVAAPTPYAYRHRVRLKVRGFGQECRIGFFRRRSHDLLDVEECAVSHPRINEVLRDLRGYLRSEGRSLCDHVKEIQMEVSPSSGLCRVFLHVRPPVDSDLAKRVARRVPSAASIALQSVEEGEGTGHRWVREASEEEDWEVEEGVFSQVNREQNRVLREVVETYAAVGREDRVLDLFCGNGNLSLALAPRVASILGIDLDPGAVSSARHLAAKEGFKNCQFWDMDALQGVLRLAMSGKNFSVVILDPPRQGCRPLVEPLCRLRARRLIYVSCHPVNLIRDLALFASCGYETREIQGIDMFPQTYHSELVALLGLRG